MSLADGRTIVGTFLAFDKHLNLVLVDAEEYRNARKSSKGGGSAVVEERVEKRTLGLIILRGENVVSVAVDGPPPPSSKAAAAGGGGPGVARGVGRGVPPPSHHGGPPPGMPFGGMAPMGLGVSMARQKGMRGRFNSCYTQHVLSCASHVVLHNFFLCLAPRASLKLFSHNFFLCYFFQKGGARARRGRGDDGRHAAASPPGNDDGDGDGDATPSGRDGAGHAPRHGKGRRLLNRHMGKMMLFFWRGESLQG